MSAQLNEKILIDQALAELLEGEVVLGGELEDQKFSARPGDQPIAFKLRDVFKKLKVPVPNELALYDMFEVWLVPHRVSIIRKPGNKAEVTSVGMEIEYAHNKTTCSVISLIPSPKFITHGRVGVQGLFQGKVSASGDFSPASEELQFKAEEKVGKLSLGVLTSGEVGFSFKAEVITPIISAVGIGASKCEWEFSGKVDNEALFGKDIETWTVLALPRMQTELSYRLRYYICTRTFYFSTRRQSEWTTISVKLT